MPGVEVLYLRHTRSPVAQLPDFRLARLAEQLAPILRQFDIVYSFSPGHPAMHAIRERRFSPSLAPIFVTVVEWVPKDRVRDTQVVAVRSAKNFGEHYQVRHSDYLACTAKDQAQQFYAQNWLLPPEDRVRFAGKDPSRWSSLHREIVERANSSSLVRKPLASIDHPAVTVCMPYFNQAEHLEAALESIARQESSDFTVTVVDDGSTSIESIQMFERMRERYSARGWRFVGQATGGPGSARNLAARDARSEYLLFLDPDDLASPRLIKRLLEAARLSGDDALGSWSWRIPGLGNAQVFERDRVIGSPDLLYTPVGNHEGGYSGGSISLVRRAAFDAAGGFPERLTSGFEDDALRERIAQSGYASDVIPEFLLFHRGLSEAATESERQYWSHENTRRVRIEEREASAAISNARGAQSRGSRKRMSRIDEPREVRRLLMLISQWPYPPRSPAQIRWWQMIRYLGERHELTLVTFLQREDEETRSQVERYCRAIYGVGYGGAELPDASSLPRQVRERQTLKMREAVRSATSHSYDAALIEQIFLAPYREFIAAPTILGEHHIESSLLAHTAQRREAEALRQYEDRSWPEFSVRTAVNRPDQREIQRRAKIGETVLLESGADPALRLEHPRPDTDTVLLVGNFDQYPDLDAILYFCAVIWPRACRLNPSLRLIVAGQSTPDGIKQLAAKVPFELIEDCFDIRPIAARASLSVTPLRTGAGGPMSVLASMALGLPVVSTSVGCAGLVVEGGVHLVIRDDPAAFAEALDFVLKHRRIWETLREHGLRLIEERYAWSRVLDPLHRSLLALASSG
jgi:GT2 family glycosyltransferase